MKKLITTLFLLSIFSLLFCQNAEEEKISLDFRNQKISDILLALAEISDKSIIMDETISGNATFRFADSGFESALTRFAEYCNLFVAKKDSDYYVSKISIQISKEDFITIEADEVIPELIIKKLSQSAKKTILYDPLPSEKISIRTQNASLEEILRLIFIKNSEYNIINRSGGFYIKRDPAQLNELRAAGDARIDESGGAYSVSSKRIAFNALIDNLFKKANKEYLLLNRTTTVLENIYYENKDFESLLRILLDSVNYDYKIENGVYYIFEIQKRDIVKKLKETITIRLAHISAEEVQNILPAELNTAGFIKIDRNTNSVFVTGSEEEINPILDFLKSIDKPLEQRYYKIFSVNNIGVKDAVSIIPKSLLFFDPVIVPDTASFVTQVDTFSEKQITDYLAMIDKKNLSYPIRLRYIKSDELIKYLPPSAVKENLALTGDSSLVFYTGTEDTYNSLIKEILLVDQPKPQIRYQLLVIQRQKSDNMKWGTEFTIKKTDSPQSSDFLAKISNLVNINFDIVSSFGIQFAVNLNAELGMDKAKVLADTTLNAITEEKITFQNTNTYRYRDITTDKETGIHSSTTREITSGLTLEIQGWVSGDEMITVSVTAKVSKQGAVSSSDTTNANPPPTSEKSVNTHVRAKSGEPIIIGGLLQTETDITQKQVPFLGSIPLIGLLFRSEQITVTETEFVIYLIPFVKKPVNTPIDMEKKILTYYQKYVSGEITY